MPFEERNISVVWIAGGYWQIKVVEKKMAFGSIGLVWVSMHAFWTPAMFSRLMDEVLNGLISKRCLVYLDDVIIYGKMFKGTLANLTLVMAHLHEHNLLAKAWKCELCETSIAFLVSEDSIATDHKKVEKICNLYASKDKGD